MKFHSDREELLSVEMGLLVLGIIVLGGCFLVNGQSMNSGETVPATTAIFGLAIVVALLYIHFDMSLELVFDSLVVQFGGFLSLMLAGAALYSVFGNPDPIWSHPVLLVIISVMASLLFSGAGALIAALYKWRHRPPLEAIEENY